MTCEDIFLMALLLLKITGLWRFAVGMKFELECIDENSGIE